MPEPFKNFFDNSLIASMGEHFGKAWPGFDREAFYKAAANNLDALELKERSTQITEALAVFLPPDFEAAADIFLAGLAPDNNGKVASAEADSRGITGWAIMPMTYYVGLYGLGHFDLSMTLLKEMTKRFSSEFGIRYFLLECPERTLSVLETWTGDSDQNVRRLVSEGTRPRLPWAMQLPAFIDDPAPIIPLLEALKDDGEEYVRRSVANSLNDIAKDHAGLVAQIAGRWLKDASRDKERLVRHGCRTLIKQGHRETLEAFGYGPPSVELRELKILTPRVIFGQSLEFELLLKSTSLEAQAMIIDYAIYHRKANGRLAPKVFKWKTTTLGPHAVLTVKRKHAIRKITTRVYYPGTHRLDILVNGVSLGSQQFELVM